MKKLIGFLVASLAVSVAAAAAFYVGYNPNTNLSGQPGVPVATGVMPVLSGAGCGTLATVQASEVGGAGVVQFTSNATSCVLTVTTAPIAPATVAAAVPNGLFCVPVDETHPTATTAVQTAHTTTSCTVSVTGANVANGDLILVEINGF